MSKKFFQKLSTWFYLAAAPILALLASPGLALAQTTPPCDDAQNVNGSGICLPKKPEGVPSFESLGALIGAILEVALMAVGLIAVLFVVIGGYQYILGSRSGEKGEVQKAKQTITNAIVGLIIVILAYSFVRITANILT